MTTPEQNVSTFPILTKTKVKDLAGQRFGKLLVVSRAANARLLAEEVYWGGNQ